MEAQLDLLVPGAAPSRHEGPHCRAQFGRLRAGLRQTQLPTGLPGEQAASDRIPAPDLVHVARALGRAEAEQARPATEQPQLEPERCVAATDDTAADPRHLQPVAIREDARPVLAEIDDRPGDTHSLVRFKGAVGGARAHRAPPVELRPRVARPHCVSAAKRSASSTGSPVNVGNSPPSAIAPAPPRYTGYSAASSPSAPAISLKRSALTALMTTACGRAARAAWAALSIGVSAPR